MITNKLTPAVSIIHGLVIATLVAGASGCTDEAEEARSEFEARATGTWRLEREQMTPGGTAYVVQTLTIQTERESLLVEAFGDPGYTVPLLKYDSGGPFVVVGVSDVVADAFELELQNDKSLLTAFVTDPAFLASIGIDDCGLVAGEAKDISNGCGEPTFTVTACIDLDLFQVAAGGSELRTGAPGVDRCVERPTAVGGQAYLRAP